MISRWQIGQQGGSVARSLLQNSEFHVRCLSRDKSSSKASELRALGAEVVQIDGSDEESICKAIASSWGIFINNGYTNTVFDFQFYGLLLS